MPQSNVMMAIPGVLARQTSRLVVAQPVPIGVALLVSLRAQFRVHLVSDDTEAETRHWLTQMGIMAATSVSWREDVQDWEYLSPVERRRAQLHHLRSWSNNPEIVIDPDPDVVAMALEEGAIGMLFAHPAYARPEFRPDYELTEETASPRLRRSWDELSDAVRKDNAASLDQLAHPVDVVD
jgi:hypothetical protein